MEWWTGGWLLEYMLLHVTLSVFCADADVLFSLALLPPFLRRPCLYLVLLVLVPARVYGVPRCDVSCSMGWNDGDWMVVAVQGRRDGAGEGEGHHRRLPGEEGTICRMSAVAYVCCSKYFVHVLVVRVCSRETMVGRVGMMLNHCSSKFFLRSPNPPEFFTIDSK